MNLGTTLQILQLISTTATLCGMAYVFYKFINKPHDSLEERVRILEIKVSDYGDSLDHAHSKLREEKKVDSLIINSIVALIEFEADYCIRHGGENVSPSLLESKKRLYEYLAEK